MRRYILILLSISLFALGGCSTLSKTRKSTEPKPEWVDNRPTAGMYYIGIGSARTAGLAPDAFKENARNSALNALSSEISVNISSSSVINTIETDYQLSETYTRQIKSSSDQNIEGYEVVDTWDGGETYWVYCRLSKAQYQAQKAEKKNAALQQAKTKYLQAIELKNSGKQYDAISSYLDGFADLSEYLAEPTDIMIEEKTVDLGTTIYRELIQSFNEIKFSSKENPVYITSGMSIDLKYMEVRLTNSAGKPVINMPVLLSFTGAGLLENRLTSDQNGVVHIPINKITSKNQTETLTVELDMLTLSRLTKDIFIRTVIRKVPAPTYKLMFNVQSPTIFLESAERKFGKTTNDQDLKDAMFQAMAKNNMRVASSASNADFIVRIESDTRNTETSAYQQSVGLRYTVTVLDKQKRIVYSKQENDIMGFGDTLEAASQEAIREGINKMKRKTANSVFESLFK